MCPNNELDVKMVTNSNTNPALETDQTITSSAGDDILTGGLGNDTINGDAGNDVLHGDSGVPGTWHFETYDRNFGTSDGQAFDIETTGSTRTGSGYVSDFNESELTNTVRGTTGNPADFGVIYTSTLNITDAGTYRFTTQSDDGSTMQIFDSAGNPVSFDNQTGGTLDYLNNDFHQASTTRYGDVVLDAGETYTIQIRYWENGGGDQLSATVTGPNPGDIAEDLLTSDLIGLPPGPDYSVTGTAAGVEGNDSIDGGAGNDTIMGDGGNDTLLGGADNDSIDGGIGDDILEGGTGADTLYGGFGQDTLDGGDGADLLDGGRDNDSIIGGLGDDTILANYGTDTMEGGEGIDTYDVANSEVNFLRYDVNLTTGTDQYNNQYTNIENVIGGDQGDSITGDTVDNVLDGDGGNDTLEGAAGDDTLIGGAGDDVFVYNSGDGNDTISDFNADNSGAIDDGDQTNNDLIDLDSFYDNIFELRDDLDDDGLLNQSAGVRVGNTALDGTIELSGVSSADLTFDNTNVACFTAGCMIQTQDRAVAVEELQAGMMLKTLDNGYQPVRAVLSRKVPALNTFAPVVISKNALGNHAELVVSPAHRMLITDWRADLLFGQDEVLVGAKALCNGDTIYRRPMPEVVYYHILLDQHEVIFAEGAPTESYHLSSEADIVDDGVIAEIEAIFPELMSCAGPSVRPTLRSYEVKALQAMMA